MAAILILGVKVPFTKGGQEVLVNTLAKELTKRGHTVDIVEIPYHPIPKEGLLNQAAFWRALDLREFGAHKVDLVIATKFPSYYVKHPKKSLWLVHQHRAIFELYGSRYSDISDDPRDENLRRMLSEGDKKVIGECSFISGISKNVTTRLKDYCNISGTVLYPPLPLGGKYYTAKAEPYILSVGRLCTIKRVDMMIKAMPIVHNFIKLKVVGAADEPGVMEYYQNEICKHHLQDRIEFLGRVSDEELLSLYAKSLAVYYAPHDEDYGYVTLEAGASSKPIITATDSGGVLEFITHEKNGLIVAPNSDSIGHATNKLAEDFELAEKMGIDARKDLEALGMLESGWEEIVNGLLSPIVDINSKKSSS